MTKCRTTSAVISQKREVNAAQDLLLKIRNSVSVEATIKDPEVMIFTVGILLADSSSFHILTFVLFQINKRL